MRILFTAQAAFSHVHPLVLPLARSAREAGHDVLVATSPELAPDLDLPAGDVLVLPRSQPLGQVMRRLSAEAADRPRTPDAGPAANGTSPELFARGFVSTIAPTTAEDLLAACGDRPPDLVVREASEFGGHLAAEVLGVPHRVLDIGPMSHASDPVVLAALDVQRARFGLPPLEPGRIWGSGRIGVVPEAFYPPSLRPAGAGYFQVPSPRRPTPLPRTVADLPGDRPLVLAGLGSNAAMVPGIDRILDAIIVALGRLPVSAVVALGADQDPWAWTGARAPNVVLESFVPQQELLSTCDLFITHAGFNGVREAIAAGVPMVALPLFADQPATAARVEEIGLGRVLDPAVVDPETLAVTVARTLRNPAVRCTARAMQRQTLALPPLVDALTAP
ncbi:glycosyltransferase [Streptomyces sp. SL13]|jgi:hypothetical protein|uniref:Glycosyltransferase n=1 Tax=Streptantibioticus silvisoli TaxID=2705255 RepID=A0AA90KH63_9ACTN|nr:glycosyltransferase [Streptantibioticus silvisoli]MDI5961223.1 glycosyltransferase [Streptantibioticus silvisoli]MDI5971024.1 glycosyltransferase [Streptantibioticus silvisoli]